MLLYEIVCLLVLVGVCSFLIVYELEVDIVDACWEKINAFLYQQLDFFVCVFDRECSREEKKLTIKLQVSFLVENICI